MTTVTIQYDIRDNSEEVAKLLCIPQELCYLNLEVDYIIFPGFIGSRDEPPEPAEVDFPTYPIVCSIETTTGNFIPTPKQSMEIYYEILDCARLQEACESDHRKELDDWLVDKADRIRMDREDWGRL
jgi:hypothetical protein